MVAEQQIALTDVQKAALIWPSRIEDWREVLAYRLEGGAPMVNAARQLHEMGLLERKTRRFYADPDMGTLYRLSPSGLAMRKRIEARSGKTRQRLDP